MERGRSLGGLGRGFWRSCGFRGPSQGSCLGEGGLGQRGASWWRQMLVILRPEPGSAAPGLVTRPGMTRVHLIFGFMVLPGACDEVLAGCVLLAAVGWLGTLRHGLPGPRCGAWASGFPWGSLRSSPPVVTPLGPAAWGEVAPPLPCGDNGGRDLGLCKAQVSGNISSLRAPGAASCSAPRGARLGCGVCGRGSRWGPRTQALQSVLPPGPGVPCATGAAGPSYFLRVGPRVGTWPWGWARRTRGQDGVLAQAGWGGLSGRGKKASRLGASQGWAGWQPSYAWPGALLFCRVLGPQSPASPWPTRLVPGTEGCSLQRGDLSPGGQLGGGGGPAWRPAPQLRFSPGASLPPRCRSAAGGRRGPCGWAGGRAHVPSGAGNRSLGCW